MNPILLAGILLLAFFSLIFLWVWWGDRRALRDFARRYKAAQFTDGHGNDITHIANGEPL